MKVYVSELPNSCCKCPCESECWCNLMGYVLDSEDVYEKRPKQCPLQSLSDYTKQVRKEVVQEIRGKMTYWEDCLTKEVTEYVIDKETLDKIEQGETK